MGDMEKEEIARIVRQTIVAVLLQANPGPEPLLEKLEYVLGCAEIAQAVIERLGLASPDN